MSLWSKSLKTTIILSDLHLCDVEPFDPKRPYWKKYKTSEFHFDDESEALLVDVQHKFKDQPLLSLSLSVCNL